MKYRDKNGVLHEHTLIKGESAFESAQIGGYKKSEEQFYKDLGKLATTDNIKAVKDEISGEIDSVKSELVGKLEDIIKGDINFGGGSDYDNIQNPVKRRIGLISDIHVKYFDGKNDLIRALSTLKKIGCSHICFCGDVSSITSFNADEYRPLLEAMATQTDYVLGENFLSCRGNHDRYCTEEFWKQTMGCDSNFYSIIDGDVYLFLSINHEEGNSENSYSNAIAYLESIKAEIDGKRMFVFIHYPFTGHAGVQAGKRYGFKSVDEETAFYDYFKTQKAIIFGGHSHLSYTDEEIQSNINIDKDGMKNFATVHLPSIAYIRDYIFKDTKQENDESQCMVMDVYDGYVCLHCIDLKAQSVMSYNYVVFDELGRKRKNLIDYIYTIKDSGYDDVIDDCKSAYSDLFSSTEVVDNAILGVSTKVVSDTFLQQRNEITYSYTSITDNTPYNEVGYKLGTRTNSSGEETLIGDVNMAKRAGVTGYIPLQQGDTLLLNDQLMPTKLSANNVEFTNALGQSWGQNLYLSTYNSSGKMVYSLSAGSIDMYASSIRDNFDYELYESGCIKSMRYKGFDTKYFVRFTMIDVDKTVITRQ